MNISIKELLCITCPNGCRLRVEERGGAITVTGNRCKRGAAFAETEIRNPVRTLTTTVATVFSGCPVLPVRTAGEIPKGRIRDVMNLINSITVSEPLGTGEVVAENVLGLGVNIIATSDMLKASGAGPG
jgi:CxxC motif-containing protein